MKSLYENKQNQGLPENHEYTTALPVRSRQNLRAHCENCFGLCCVSLYFSASDGFPIDKEGGQPCPNQQADFRCGVHDSLRKRGFKGCSAFDCFGAGPKVAQITFEGRNWRQMPESANNMFEAFLIMRQLHELLWYLTDALAWKVTLPIHDVLNAMLEHTEGLTHMGLESLLKIDVAAHRSEVNGLLLQTSELVRAEALRGQKSGSGQKKTLKQGADLMGADLRKTDLRGANLRGAYLIAADLRGVDLNGADLIGADFRDADISGADLSKSIFLTQFQLNVAKGDANTKLPPSLVVPTHWSNTKI